MSVFVPNQRTILPSSIAYRHHARQEGAKLAIGAAQRENHVERLSGCDRRLPTFQDFRQRLRVMHRLPAPALHLFRRGARVLVPAIVVPENPAVRVRHPAQLRDRVGQSSKLRFALAEGLLRPLPFAQVPINLQDAHGHVPAVPHQHLAAFHHKMAPVLRHVVQFAVPPAFAMEDLIDSRGRNLARGAQKIMDDLAQRFAFRPAIEFRRAGIPDVICRLESAVTIASCERSTSCVLRRRTSSAREVDRSDSCKWPIMKLISTPTSANSVRPATAPELHREGAACGSTKNHKTLSVLSTVAAKPGPLPDSGRKHNGERERQIRRMRAQKRIERQPDTRGSQYDSGHHSVAEHRGAIFGEQRFADSLGKADSQ